MGNDDRARNLKDPPPKKKKKREGTSAGGNNIENCNVDTTGTLINPPCRDGRTVSPVLVRTDVWISRVHYLYTIETRDCGHLPLWSIIPGPTVPPCPGNAHGHIHSTCMSRLMKPWNIYPSGLLCTGDFFNCNLNHVCV